MLYSSRSWATAQPSSLVSTIFWAVAPTTRVVKARILVNVNFICSIQLIVSRDLFYRHGKGVFLVLDNLGTVQQRSSLCMRRLLTEISAGDIFAQRNILIYLYTGINQILRAIFCLCPSIQGRSSEGTCRPFLYWAMNDLEKSSIREDDPTWHINGCFYPNKKKNHSQLQCWQNRSINFNIMG